MQSACDFRRQNRTVLRAVFNEPVNPLNEWAGRRIGAPVTRENIDAYQFRALRDTLLHVKKHSRFYGGRLVDIDIAGGSARELLRGLPFCRPDDLRASPSDFLCVSQAEVSRVAAPMRRAAHSLNGFTGS